MFTNLRTWAAGILVAIGLSAGPAAALTVDPTTGGSGDFFWDDGLGDSVMFGSPFPGTDDTLKVTLATTSALTFSVEDCCIVGDTFGLLVDGVATAWTYQLTLPYDHFEASVDLVLSAGVHTIDMYLTSLAFGCEGDEGYIICEEGQGYWDMTAASPIPLPAGFPLLLGSLAAFGLVRRRKRG